MEFKSTRTSIGPLAARPVIACADGLFGLTSGTDYAVRV